MRAFVTRSSAAASTGLAAVVGNLLLLAGCSAPATAPASADRAPASPSVSVAPPVRFLAPAEVRGLPRTTAAEWTKIPKSRTDSYRRTVLRPTDTLTAVYLDPADLSESIEFSAAAGPVHDPAAMMRVLVGNLDAGLEDVRPADPGTPGGVGRCGVSRRAKPALVTMCHWADPGGVGSVTVWSLKDRRAWFADLRAEIRTEPAG
jgi:hypothetical protein